MDTGSTSMDNLIESLTNTLALLNQSFKAHLPQTNNQLRTSSNARNNATVQDGRVVVQDEFNTALFKEVKVMEEIFDFQKLDEVDQELSVLDKQCAEIVQLIIITQKHGGAPENSTSLMSGDSVLQDSVNATPTVKIILNKGKQIWKPKGKLSNNSLNKTKQVWKATTANYLLMLVIMETTAKPTGPTQIGDRIFPNPPNSNIFKCRWYDHLWDMDLRLFKLDLEVGSNSKQSHVALAGPNPEHMQAVFLATNYPKIATRFSFEGKIVVLQTAVPNNGALTASADVCSSITETTDTTSTLPPPPPPPQKPTGHRDIWEKVKDQRSRMHH
ncbi:hypothetical protein Tco_0275835 [Tanacetum coccineum]